MKNLFLLLLGIISIVVSCTKVENRSTAVTTSADISNAYYTNKFGYMSNQSYNNANPSTWPATAFSLDRVHSVAQASNLGVAYYRMQISQISWNQGGTNQKKYRDSSLKELVTAKNNLLKVLLNLNNQSDSAGGSKHDFPTGTDLTTYTAFVTNVLDSTNNQGANPYMVVVENEEDNASNFNITTWQQCVNYANELKAAKTVCDGRGIICTNGGLIARRLISATYYNNVTANPSNITAYKTWAYSVLPNNYYYGLIDTSAIPSGFTKYSASLTSQQISIEDTLLHLYDSIAHLAYVNIHWYEPQRAASWTEVLNNNKTPYQVISGRPATDSNKVVPGGISPVISMLGSKFPGATIISNEAGQINISSCLATSLCGLINSYFAIGVLYGGDSKNDPSYGAKSYYSNLSSTTYSRRITGDAVNFWITSGSAVSQCQ